MNPYDGTQAADRTLRGLRMRWWWIVIGAVLGAIVLSSLSWARSSTYTSTASVVVRQISENPFGATSTTVDKQLNMPNEVALGSSEAVLTRTLRTPGVPAMQLTDLRKDISVSSPPNTTVLNFAYATGNKKLAPVVSNALANAYLAERKSDADTVANSQARSLQTSIDQLDARRLDAGRRLTQANTADLQTALTAELSQINGGLRDLETQRATLDAVDTTPGDLVKPAVVSNTPDGPSTKILLVVGALLGALAALALAIARIRTSRRVYSVEDLAGTAGLGVVVELPRGSGKAAVEAWRVLAVRLTHHEVGAQYKKLVVTSPQGEADATSAARLAAALNELGVQAAAVGSWVEASSQQVAVHRAPLSGGARTLRALADAQAAVVLVERRRRLPELQRLVEVLQEAGVTVLATALLTSGGGGGGGDGQGERAPATAKNSRFAMSDGGQRAVVRAN